MNTAVVSKRRPAIHTVISDDSKLYLVYVGVRKITTSLAPVKLRKHIEILAGVYPFTFFQWRAVCWVKAEYTAGLMVLSSK